jgi:hypothetical protein
MEAWAGPQGPGLKILPLEPDPDRTGGVGDLPLTTR